MQSALNWLQHKSTNGDSNNVLQSSKKHMETAKQLMREAHEDSPDLERIGEANVGAITLDRFSAPKSEEVCSTLVNELAAARKDAMKCFEAKGESTVEARIDALRIAIHSSSLYRLFVTKTLGNSDNLDFWMTEIFTDNELNDSVKAAIKINEDTWPLKQAYRQRASYLVKVNNGLGVIEILKELKALFSPSDENMRKLLKKHFSQDDRFLIPIKSMMEQNLQPYRPNFGVKLHSEQHSIEQLKKAYIEKLQHYNPFGAVLGTEVDMKDSFVPITIVGQVRNQEETVSDIEELIKKAFHKKSRLAVVRGEALSGKTTLTQKICYDWATGVAFSQYDLILLSELRNARDDRYETILDVAQAAIRDNDCLNRIDYADKRTLVLLDGYDEKRETQVCNQLDRLLKSEARIEYPFDLLITTRPSRKIERKSGASFWRIIGLVDEAKRKEYIHKCIQFRLSLSESDRTSLDDHCSSVNAKLQHNGALNDLAKSPIMLTFICLVHERLAQGSKAELFSAIIRWILLNHNQKWPKQRMIQRLWGVVELPDKLSEQEASDAVEKWRQFVHIQRLGHLAFNGELNKKRVLEVFPPDQLGGTGQTAINKFESIGLLKETQQHTFSGSTTTMQVPKHQFVHRVFQEFLAALYLLYWSSENTEVHKLLREKSAWSSSIDPKHIDLGQMTFDILMAERSANALNSIRLLLSTLTTNKTTPISFQSRINMQPEHEFLHKVLQQCRKLASLHINGSGADVNFPLKISLPALNNEYN
uniref:NACHT domain-containing protein n=1 Tax=Plectus sambesii TaxID=2011161 RepID=A0A914UVR3_9BILA